MRRAPAPPPLPDLEAQLEATVQKIWSTNTWKMMKSLWNRFVAFGQVAELPLDQHSAALFVNSMSVSMQTKHTYTRNLINVFRKLNKPHGELTLLDTALRAQGALIPLHQALPIPRHDVLRIYTSIDLNARMQLMLAWKTASRWDEIQRLTKNSILLNTRTEIVLYFWQETKGSRTQPFRPDLFVVIRGLFTVELSDYLCRALGQTRTVDTPLFHIPTEKIREILEPWGFSAHSLKRGAILHLLTHLPEGSPHLGLIPLLGKHAPHYPVFQDLTIRYGTEAQVEIARHLGTGILTALL